MEPPRKLDAHRLRDEERKDLALMAALGRLLRGLSALFWGIPLFLVAAVQCVRTDIPRGVQAWSMLATCFFLPYGVHMMGFFQPQERIWQRAVDRVRVLGLVVLGFSPFLFWWSRFTGERAFQAGVDVLGLSFLLFLHELNRLLDRLVAMIPDEALRQETQFFTKISRMILAPILGIVVIYSGLGLLEIRIPEAGPWFAFLSEGGLWTGLFLALLPVAMTMALIWKIKSILFESVFGA